MSKIAQGAITFSARMIRVRHAPLVFLLLFAVAPTLHAQFTEDFADSDLTSNPTWSGDTGNFTVNSGRLQLTAPAEADVSYLSTYSPVINDAEWVFDVEMDFLTSSTSLTRFYLVSDEADLTQPLDGYFVEIGNTADNITLHKQTGTDDEIVINDQDKTIDTNPVLVRVKVTRDDLGHWALYKDVGITGDFTEEGEADDLGLDSSSFFGLYCKYTKTRSNLFFFDNIQVSGLGYLDRDPPVLDSLSVTASSRLRLYFNEPLERTSASAVTNYTVDNGVGNPQYAELEDDSTTVDLLFTDDFPNGDSSKIALNNVKDLAGNVIGEISLPFLFFQPAPVNSKDVIITEILADPLPPVSLPEEEYVELFNRSDNPVELRGWTITDGHSDGNFPEKIIQPGTYWIVTSASVAASFSAYPNVIGIDHFPGLNNDGDNLKLIDNEAKVVDEVDYRKDWYHNDDKAEGGWSLELIDPENTCAADVNWTASASPTGGTPGMQNSVFAIRPDVTGPGLTHAIPIDATTVRFQFDERLNALLPGVESFAFTPRAAVHNVSFSDSTLRTLDISCDSLASGVLYTVALSGIRDCPGNLIRSDANQATFGLPEDADRGDVVINEILFNPTPTGVDFVELYNASSKYINLRDWSVGNWSDSLASNRKIIIDQDLLLAPASYLALTENKTILASEYINAPAERIMQVPSLPAFPDDEGSVAVANSDQQWIDHFSYSDKMHSPFLKETEGVSLERLDPSSPTQDANNWKSAASAVGYATPGYVNSNTVSQSASNSTILVDPEIFRPESGTRDHTVIRYRMDHAGYVGTVTIHNLRGSIVKTLAENQILGTSGFFRWDGDKESGERASLGYYYVMFDAFDQSGDQVSVVKRVIVADQF